MDQDERIEQLKEEARRLSGGRMQSFGIDDLPRDVAEQFLKRVVAFESGPTTTDFDRLTVDRVPLPPPDEVPNRDIGAILWRVIFGLAKLRVFLSRTNHLNPSLSSLRRGLRSGPQWLPILPTSIPQGGHRDTPYRI